MSAPPQTPPREGDTLLNGENEDFGLKQALSCFKQNLNIHFFVLCRSITLRKY
jgi:hypothetical protein